VPPAEHPSEPEDRRALAWLDRWLEPRWRALLTWMALAAGTVALVELGGFGLIVELSNVVFIWAKAVLPNAVPPWWWPVAAIGAIYTFLWQWFAPVILRVGLWRSLTWLGLAVLITVSDLASVLFFRVFGPDSNNDLHIAFAFALPGLAVAGRRSRPWMSLVGGVLVAAAGFAANQLPGLSHPIIKGTLAHFIYAAVMLYGTRPLSRSS